MEEKKYLKWYNKVGYGSGDLAGNVVYAFLSSFVMLYLTNTVGLNPGIIGTLIMVSKLFDGISDMFFGTMIDKTKSKLGKARPWMLYAYIGCAVTLVANFAIPDTLGTTAQYAWFFVAYTLLNAVFFTANNIAYASLVTFCTKNSRERVEMGSWRFIFAFSTSLLIQSVTVQFVRAAGGGAAAWRTVAVVYAVIGLIVNTISVFSIKELPEEELKAGKDHTEEKYGLVEAAKLLFSNKYYLMICATYICQQIHSENRKFSFHPESGPPSWRDVRSHRFLLPEAADTEWQTETDAASDRCDSPPPALWKEHRFSGYARSRRRFHSYGWILRTRAVRESRSAQEFRLRRSWRPESRSSRAPARKCGRSAP